jgi:glycosyltransferase involved in cell wall biosynthesis
MQKGLVSVLCLSMNHEKFVEQGYTSVLNQTYKHIEVLYADNNSKDRTFEIADSIFKKSSVAYKGFKRTENYGISANLNFLLKEATGEFIAILSGDDWWEPDNLELKVSYFNRNPEFGLLYGNGYKYFELEKRKHLFYEVEQKSGFLFNDLLRGNFFYAGSVVTRHNCLKEIGFFDENLTIEDWDMHLRMAEKYPIGYIHEPLSYSRVTGNNLSSNIEFMNKGYEYYFKKYAKYPEMREVQKGVKLSQAFQLANYSPGLKSLKYILTNMQWNSGYIKQVIRCIAGMVGIKFNVKGK